jgi:hypothetical protein
MSKIVGHEWADIQRAQQTRGASLSRAIDLSKPGDYGASPIGDGTFRMVPSGDVVDYAERCRRLANR